jgi:hypothetical protein
MTIASPRQPNGWLSGGPRGVTRLWVWLSRCEAQGCAERPVHLGWCAEHTPAYTPAPDEYWGDVHRGEDAPELRLR